jgi:hypothetical protein
LTVGIDYPRILTTSDNASIQLNSGEVIHCWQGRLRVYIVSVGPKATPVYVAAKAFRL